MSFRVKLIHQMQLLTPLSSHQQIIEVKRKLNEEEKELLESRFKFPDPPKRQQLAIQQGADEARKEINSRIEEVNPELKSMGKTHKDQPIEVSHIIKNSKYRKANDMGMTGA